MRSEPTVNIETTSQDTGKPSHYSCGSEILRELVDALAGDAQALEPLK